MKKVYGDDCLSFPTVKRWYKRFHDGRESLEDDERESKLRTVRTPETIQKVQQFLAEDRNALVRMIADAVGISAGAVYTILTKDLGKKKICAHFVPHFLRDHEMTNREAHSRDIIKEARNDPRLLDTIVTGDETWCFMYEPETKRQGAEWLSKDEPRPKKVSTPNDVANQDNANFVLR